MAREASKIVDIVIRVSREGSKLFGEVNKDAKNLMATLKLLTKDINKLDNAFNALQTGTKTVGNAIKEATVSGGSGVEELDKKTKTALSGTLTWASAFWKVHSAILAIRAISLPVKMFADFERKMSEVSAISQASAEDMKRLELTARQLGETTEFTATQVAEGFKDLSEAGFDTEQMLSAIGPVLKLAHIGLLQMGEAADIVANIMSGFNIGAEEITRVVDEVAYVTTRSNATIRELGESMKYVGPVATAAGLDFTEVVSALGMLHDAGIKGCYDNQTEVLTRRGYIKWEDATIEDEYLTLNPETDELEYQRPIRMFKYEVDEKLLHIKNKHVNLKVTSNHNMYVKPRGKDKYELIQAKDIYGKDVQYLTYNSNTIHGRRLNIEENDLGQKWVDYKGFVYCAEVPNHTLFVRRDGTTVVCGNSMAGTTLRGVLSRLLSPTKEEAELMKDLSRTIGKTSSEFVFSGGKMRSLADIIKDLEDAGLRAGEAMELFGDRAGPGMAALLQKGSRALKDMQKEAERNVGIADEMSQKIGANLTGAFENLKGAIEELILTLWNNDKTLESLIRRFAEAVRGLKGWVDENREIISTTLKVAAALGAFTAALLALNGMFSAIGLALGTFTKGANLLGITATKLQNILGLGLYSAMTSFTGTIIVSIRLLAIWALGLYSAWKIGLNLGEMLNELSLGSLKFGDYVQIGMAKVAQAYAWLRGESTKTHQQVIEDIKAEGQARKDTAKTIMTVAEVEAKIAEARNKITKDFAAKLKELNKIWRETDTSSKQAVTAYKTAFESATSYADTFSKAAIAAADAVWAKMSNQQGVDAIRQSYLALETAQMESATRREQMLAESEKRSVAISILSTQEALAEQMVLVAEDEKNRRGLLNERRDYELRMAEATFTDSTLLTQKKKSIEESFIKDVTVLEAELFATRKKYYDQAAAVFKQGAAESLKKVEDSYQKIKDLEEQRAKFNESIEEALRQQARKTMSEAEKFSDDQSKWAENNAKARKLIASGDETLIKKGMELVEDSGKRYNELAVARLKDGKEIISQADAEYEFKKLLLESQEAYNRAVSALGDLTERRALADKEKAAQQTAAADALLLKEKAINEERAKGSKVVLSIEREQFDNEMKEVTKSKEVSIEAKLSFTDADKQLQLLVDKVGILQTFSEMKIKADWADDVSRATMEMFSVSVEAAKAGLHTTISITDNATESIKKIDESINFLDAKIKGEGLDRTYTAAFKGTNAGDVEGLTEKITRIEERLTNLDAYFGADKIRNFTVNFVGPEGIGISEYIDALKVKLDEFLLSLSPEEGAALKQVTIDFFGNAGEEPQPLAKVLQTMIELMTEFGTAMEEIKSEFVISFLGDAGGEPGPLDKATDAVIETIEKMAKLFEEEHEFILLVEEALDSLKEVLALFNNTKNQIESQVIKLNLDISQALSSFTTVQNEFDNLKSYIESNPITQVINTEMSGSTTKPFSEKLIELTNKFNKFRNILEEPSQFRIDISSGNQSLTTVLTDAGKLLNNLTKPGGSTEKLATDLSNTVAGADQVGSELATIAILLENLINKQDVLAQEIREAADKIIVEMTHIGGKITDLLKGAVIDLSEGGGKEPFFFEFPKPGTIIEPTTPLEVILVEIRYKLGELVFYLKVFTTEFKAMMVDLLKIYEGGNVRRYDMEQATGSAISPKDEPVRLSIIQTAEYLRDIKYILTQGFQNIGAIPFPDDVNYVPPYVSGAGGLGGAGTDGPRIVVDFNLGNGNVYSGLFREDDAMNMVEQLQRAQESAL